MKKLLFFSCISMLFACRKNMQETIAQETINTNTEAPTASVTGSKPKDIFDVSKWILSLPLDINNQNLNTGVTSISAATLTGGYALDPYFYVPASPYNDRVRFWCPIDGATTSPGSGSDHPRTELREVLQWQSQYYSTNAYPTIGGRLEGECMVKQSPSGSSHIIFAQIHGGGNAPYKSYPFVMLSYRHDTVLATIKSDTIGSTGTKLYLLKGVTLNTKIKFSVSDSLVNGTPKIFVWAYAPGSTNINSPANLAVPSKWLTVPIRFQAGDYVQAETDDTSTHVPNSTDGGKIDFFSLKITH